MRGGEFTFRFVEAGTSTLMPAFERLHATFYDVDGQVQSGSTLCAS